MGHLIARVLAEARVNPVGHAIERGEELADFVVPGLGDTAVKIAGAEIVQSPAEKLDRAGEKAGDKIKEIVK